MLVFAQNGESTSLKSPPETSLTMHPSEEQIQRCKRSSWMWANWIRERTSGGDMHLSEQIRQRRKPTLLAYMSVVPSVKVSFTDRKKRRIQKREPLSRSKSFVDRAECKSFLFISEYKSFSYFYLLDCLPMWSLRHNVSNQRQIHCLSLLYNVL